MKYPVSTSYLLLAMPALSVLSCASVATESAERDTPGEARGALAGGVWGVDRVRGTGGGCRFQADDAGVADAFAIASGGDVSLIFTRLGEGTRRGRGRLLSESLCAFTVPLNVPAGYFFSGWAQSVQYGIVKPAGVAAGLSVRSMVAPAHGLAFDLPTLQRRFERASAVNIALDVLSSEGTTSPDGAKNPAASRKRWCLPNRDVDHELRGTARTFVERTRDDKDDAVIIAVDGLDMRADFAATLDACPAR